MLEWEWDWPTIFLLSGNTMPCISSKQVSSFEWSPCRLASMRCLCRLSAFSRMVIWIGGRKEGEGRKWEGRRGEGKRGRVGGGGKEGEGRWWEGRRGEEGEGRRGRGGGGREEGEDMGIIHINLQHNRK